ncbi:MAG: acyl-CoA dehydrogenase [Deltaproteobacteria bacterium]|nr:acyl-CoA dehydrogenase [Deltaproteobacteria bacterium]MBT6615303.1 acyl-CoA dehydrogenase [Deltaproteobacteria bacterium]MBT7716304.1 acyl-CoA dehydrogenase [Deltaproteobacteria bacterium]
MSFLNYTEDHQQFRQRLQKFCQEEIVPYADQWEADHMVPRDKWKQMGEAGFLCTAVAKEYGGLGGDFLYSVIVAEELMKTESMGLMAPLHSDIIVPYISTFGTAEIKQKYLPHCVSGEYIAAVAMTEPGAGSDVASMECTAVEDGDEVVLNGSKTFISNGINCGFVIVAVKDPAIEKAHNAISLYIVDSGTVGFERGRQLEKMGMYSQDTAELFFSDCRIPKSNLLGEKNNGFIQLMQKLQQERLVVTIQAMAGIEYVVEKTVALCKQVDSDGTSFSQQQATQFALVEMLAEAKVLGAFVDQLIVGHMQGENVVTETSIAKYKVSEAYNQIINQSLNLLGEFGSSERNRLARIARDAKVQTIYAGTTEVMKTIVAKSMGL